MQKKSIVSLALAGAWFVASSAYAQFGGTVVSYVPGTGFSPNFTNDETIKRLSWGWSPPQPPIGIAPSG